jgi:uncharacterized protein (TIGR02145 family)
VIDSRNICPAGWHVPTIAQWSQLAAFSGGKFVEDYKGSLEGYWSNVGGKLKEAGTAHWKNPNLDAVNSIGFTGLQGGNRGYDGVFYSIKERIQWWSDIEDGPRKSSPGAF